MVNNCTAAFSEPIKIYHPFLMTIVSTIIIPNKVEFILLCWENWGWGTPEILAPNYIPMFPFGQSDDFEKYRGTHVVM
jgi:hypothetical protein